MQTKNIWKFSFGVTFAAVIAIAGLQSCAGAGGGADVGSIARDRNLSDADVVAALKTYQPTGRMDDYILFGSGGHSGQVMVIGVPSMRLLKVIAAFTPEPWQGYGYGSADHAEILEGAQMGGREITWGDSHHPALSETDADYDGEFLFINDKANPRVA
ncbi:MAG: cytochrome C, partial [Gemmatimonadota bacterium]|nr:cytochrome C [Gemmatimonadota bacterium]